MEQPIVSNSMSGKVEKLSSAMTLNKERDITDTYGETSSLMNGEASSSFFLTFVGTLN